MEIKKLHTKRLASKFQVGTSERYLTGADLQNRLDDAFMQSQPHVPKWSKETDKVDSDDEISTSVMLKKKRSKNLTIEHLDIRKSKYSVPFKENQSSRFKSLRFHQHQPLLGHIDSNGKYVQLTKIQNEPELLNQISFDLKNKHKIVDIAFSDNYLYSLTNFKNKRASDRMQCHIYSYDLTTGQSLQHKNIRGLDTLASKRFIPSSDGKFMALFNHQPTPLINILSMKNNQPHVIRSLRQSERINDSVAFSTAACDFCVATLSNQEVLFYDLRNAKRCVRTMDCGNIVKGSRLAVSTNGKRLAIGGNTGYVSFYEYDSDCMVDNGTMTKEFSNLTTAITSLEFSGDLLLFGSPGNWTQDDDFESYNFFLKFEDS